MAGTALSNFTDFVKATGPAYFTGPDQFLNEAVKTTYSLSRFLRGKELDKVIQSGDRILDDVMFDEASTYTKYHPNAQFTWSQPQVVTEQAIDWRFSMDHMAWTDQTVTLNVNPGLTRGAARVQYLKLRKKLEQRMWTSMINGMEADIWADGSGQTSEMEAQAGKEPFSIPAFVTENTGAGAYHPNGWTTIMGINPETETKWRNQVATYDYDDPDDTDGDADGLIDAFDTMWTDVAFMPPNFHNEHFESAYTADRQAIFCSKGGLNQYKRLLRAANDTLVSKQDAAYQSPKFAGIDVVRVGHLDTATYDWDHDGTAAQLETAADTDGYRYFWINGNYLTPIFHTERYFYKKDPYFLPDQPWSWVCPVDCWWNLFCHSRQRQGIVAPQ
jgi:hypothetical protein